MTDSFPTRVRDWPGSSNRSATIAVAVMFMVAALYYFVSELVTAAAWKDPTYDYISGFISDLGSGEQGTVFQGRLVNSPLHDVINVAFIVHGVLFVIAAVMLYRMIGGKGRFAYLVFAVLHGVGISMVGTFHESPTALTNGVIILHSIGATTAILGGNAAAITLGALHGRIGVPRWFGIASFTIGIFGLLSFVVLQILRTPPVIPIGGLVERGAVDTIMIAEFLVGIILLGQVRRRVRAVV